MTFERAALETALEKLLSEKHFSICRLEKIGKVMGVNVEQSPSYKYLNLLHCVDYADMKPEILAELQQKIAECLRPTFQPGLIARAILIEGSDFVAEDPMPKLGKH